jgi:acyl-CoA synthetase (AMP-forming)/AMP-acid ligase II/acyl carrier protein
MRPSLWPTERLHNAGELIMSPVGLVPGSNDSAADLCISQLIENQAKRIPDAIAIAAPDRTPLTYTRLHRQIDDTVKKLNAMGVGRRDRVALALPNGPEMAVAFLAVAASATCAPLNPAYQVKEYDFFLADLNPKALILWSGMDSPARVAARERDIPIIELSPVLDAEAGVFALAGDLRLRPVDSGFTQPDDVALVLHTSGTTSRPKIIPLTHSNICASTHNIRAALELVRRDRCLNVMPLFHIHGLIGAVLSSLAAGASVVCTPGFYAPKFFAWMEEFRPTWYTAVPTMHQAILARAASSQEIIGRCPLRFIRSSSSRMPPQVMTELENVFHAPVIEAYGMTEASHQIASNPLPPRQRKAGSVGLAVGPEVAVMDDAGHLRRPEEVGEIVIRGANVTQGYENDSTLNERAFTEGWLRTGDQGYLDSDGYIFITGRLKEVINRGGEKISPHEVDEALTNHPAIAQAVTFAVPHSTLGEDIAAAVVLRENGAATEREIQDFAAARLADFKVPRRVIIVDAIPQGPTGKSQRIGLAEKLGLRASDGPDVRAAYTAPRTPVEEKLSEIWSEILGIQRVGVDDNFFQLGGDSLLATQVISRVREALQAELSFISFFETPTIASLAAVIDRSEIENAQREKIAQRLPALENISGRSSDESIPRRINRVSAPLSFAQERLWFLDQMEPGSPAYNRPANFRLAGRLNVKALELSLSEIVRRHEALRTRFAVESGKPVQVICPARTLTMSLVDLYELPAPEREIRAQELATEEAQRPFDLTQGPLMRATLLRLGKEDHVLLLTIHHIAFDGWSLSVLARELAALYEAFCAGRPQPLPDLPVQYADYTHWQRQWLQGDVLQTQLSYWKQQLAGVRVLDLPTDRPRPPVQTFRGAKQFLLLSSRLTNELKLLSLREGVTPFMSLLAAFTTLLHGYTGQYDIAVGTFLINRNRVETEGLIGFFINNLVLRTDLAGNPSFRELVARVRTVALAAYAHQDLPFEKLLEELRPERDKSRTPLFQVMLVLQNTPGSALDLPGLTSSNYPAAQDTRANFDLTLWMSDGIEGLSGVLEYNADLFDGISMTRMLETFKLMLEGIVADPDQHLSTLSISLDRERRRITARGNDTEAIFSVDAQADSDANLVDDTAELQAQLSKRRARLSAAKRALLEKRLRG